MSNAVNCAIYEEIAEFVASYQEEHDGWKERKGSYGYCLEDRHGSSWQHNVLESDFCGRHCVFRKTRPAERLGVASAVVPASGSRIRVLSLSGRKSA